MTDTSKERAAVAAALDAARAALDDVTRTFENLTPADVYLTIPGHMLATVDGGGIRRLAFLPWAGESFEVHDGEINADHFPELAAEQGKNDAPEFWRMVESYLTAGGPIEWEG